MKMSLFYIYSMWLCNNISMMLMQRSSVQNCGSLFLEDCGFSKSLISIANCVNICLSSFGTHYSCHVMDNIVNRSVMRIRYASLQKSCRMCKYFCGSYRRIDFRVCTRLTLLFAISHLPFYIYKQMIYAQFKLWSHFILH